MLSGTTANMQFLSNTFNAALTQALFNKKGHFLMDIEKEQSLDQFKGVYDELSDEGATKYWRELSRIICKFEYDEISLKPFIPDRRNKYQKDN